MPDRCRYPVNLEIGRGGWCMAHVPSLPGCYAKGRDMDEALRLLAADVADYLRWAGLCDPGEGGGGPAVELEVVETVEGDWPVEAGDSKAFFRSDVEPLTRGELEWQLGLLERSRRELIRAARAFTAGELERAPAPGKWSPRQILEHVANAEAWYISRLDAFGDPLEHLGARREAALRRLGSLSGAELSARTSHVGEGWTPRKVLRRFLWHERHHTKALEALKAPAGPEA